MYPHVRSEFSGPQFSTCRCGNSVVCWPDFTAVAPMSWGGLCPSAMKDEIARLSEDLDTANGAREGTADFARGVSRIPAGLPFHEGRSESFVAGWFAGWDRAESIHLAARTAARKEALEEAAKVCIRRADTEPMLHTLDGREASRRCAVAIRVRALTTNENPDG